jgi:hypothetical protein
LRRHGTFWGPVDYAYDRPPSPPAWPANPRRNWRFSQLCLISFGPRFYLPRDEAGSLDEMLRRPDGVTKSRNWSGLRAGPMILHQQKNRGAPAELRPTPSPCPSRRHGLPKPPAAVGACRFNEKERAKVTTAVHGRFPPEDRGKWPATSSNVPPAACRANSDDQKGKTDRGGKGATIAITPGPVSSTPSLHQPIAGDAGGNRGALSRFCEGRFQRERSL